MVYNAELESCRLVQYVISLNDQEIQSQVP